MHDYTVSYPELTASAERQIREYMTFAAATGDDAERGALHASAVSLFAYWLGFVNAARNAAGARSTRYHAALSECFFD